MEQSRKRSLTALRRVWIACLILLQLRMVTVGGLTVEATATTSSIGVAKGRSESSIFAADDHTAQLGTLPAELATTEPAFESAQVINSVVPKSEFDQSVQGERSASLESGLSGEAHPAYGRVAAAALLGFDRLMRPKNKSLQLDNELLEAARRDVAESNQTRAQLNAEDLEEKGREVANNMTSVGISSNAGVNGAIGVTAPKASGALDKFEADEKRAADLARYKMLINGAVKVMDCLNARLWHWGSLTEQLQSMSVSNSEAGQSRNGKGSDVLASGDIAAGNTGQTLVRLGNITGLRGPEAVQHPINLGSTACLNDCSNQGRCISRRCVCRVGYEGTDCSRTVIDCTETAPKYRGFQIPKERQKIEEIGRKLRVCFVTNEVAGPITNGGIGTAFTTMAHSLVERGHRVTILFTMGEISMRGTFQEWVAHYERAGITLLGLPRPPSGTHHIPRALVESYEVLRFLRERSFDVVHFPDYQGAGYYSMLAKKQGLALMGTALVVGVHGPSFWAKKAGNGEPITAVRSLEGNFMEQKTVALADYVVAPSQYILRWMEAEGWQLDPARTFVQPNLLPKTDRSPDTARGKRALVPVSELVFFGRLETRKGVVTFCDAVDAILGVSESMKNSSVLSPSGKEELSKAPTSNERRQEGAMEASSPAPSKDDEPSGVFSAEAVAHFSDVRSKLERVTFLGRSAIVEGEWGVEYVQRRASAWGGFPWKIVTRMDPLEAKEYLRGEGRLAVIPSKVENSPYTVYECAELGVPFIAADVGGISDFVHPEDRPHALFEPTVQDLVQRLSRALLDGVRPARPRVDAAANEHAWMTWHQQISQKTRGRDGERWAQLEATLAGKDRPFVSVVMTHYNRPALCKQALESLEAQDYPADSFEVILVDDGSTQEDAIAFLDEIEPHFKNRGWGVLRQANAYLGAARNAGARVAKGKYILFMDDDNWAKPNEVSTYVRAMEWGGADVMTSFVDFFWSADERPPLEKERPSYLFLGGSSDVGAFKNCFGDANCFVRKSSFFEIGGYTEDFGIGYEDWELYANATLRGFQVDVLSEPVYWYRFNPGSMQKTTNYFVNRRRALRPYLNLIPESEHQVLLAAVFPRRDNQTMGGQTPKTGSDNNT